MKLIADSGSTKTDWAIVADKNKDVKIVKTQGLNPFHLSGNEITEILRQELLPSIKEEVTHIYFYGTGCTPEQIPVMETTLSSVLNCNNVLVGSDLLGAAHAICGHEKGIACILGTGANSCLYDGEKIVANTPPLGYILGDEGSGAVLGKLFLNGIFKGGLSKEIRELYLHESNQTYADVIRKVYREPLANRYLASTAKFIGKYKDKYPELSNLVKANFKDFIKKNIEAYNRKNLPLGFVGSIAWYFRNELKAATEESDYRLGKIMRSPIEGMITYAL